MILTQQGFSVKKSTEKIGIKKVQTQISVLRFADD